MARYLPLVYCDLDTKHERMSASLWHFLRGTFFRWGQLWPRLCPDLAAAPGVLAVGDPHMENYGTWPDAEGRLVWGINDFDEACTSAYTSDLTRLAASAHVVIRANLLALAPEAASEAILRGYMAGMEAGGRPFILDGQNGALRALVLNGRREPADFWKRIDGLPAFEGSPPTGVREALESAMPEPGLAYRLLWRIAGMGSLGRPRFVAITEWRGGRVAREAKPLLPSAWHWSGGGRGHARFHYQTVITRAVRSRDPFTRLHGNWIVRRLGPDTYGLEIDSLPNPRDEIMLLHAMGWETANIHLGSREAVEAVRRDLRSRPSGWLHQAASAMVEATIKDWEEWRAIHPPRA